MDALPADDPRCPRCGGGFHCAANQASACACASVSLDAATLAALRRRYATCLCLRCLAQLAKADAEGRP